MYIRLKKGKEKDVVYASVVETVRKSNKIVQKHKFYLGKFYKGFWAFNFMEPIPSEFRHNCMQLEQAKKRLRLNPKRFQLLFQLLEKLECKSNCFFDEFRYGIEFGRMPRIDNDGAMLPDEVKKLKNRLALNNTDSN